ncbi:TauD/TfdA family dioxygenase [Candidatus Pelagibacter ubique]|nr:TauD/TfdA family dioxygenase [Candidatus Pelagibacter ubique]
MSIKKNYITSCDEIILNKKINLILRSLEKSNTSKEKKRIKLEGQKLIEKIKKKCTTSSKKYFIIKCNNKKRLLENIKFIISLFGKKISQNSKKEKMLLVTPNTRLIKKFKKKINDKLRYHQTNKGGSIHTDGPQHKDTPKFLLMASISNQNRGGESIVVNGKKIFDYLSKNKPTICKTLQEKYLFERRGFNYSNKNIFKKPIFENKKNFSMRYLREYITTAYKTVNEKMSPEKFKAMNYLDKLLYSEKFQRRFKLKEGEIIIINNKILAHGRTSFAINQLKPRKILRVWYN